MAEQVSPYALTTLQRVKDRIYDQNVSSQPTAFDSLLTRMVNSCSEWFERETGDRRFVIRGYFNEIYSAYNYKQTKLILRNAPIFFTTVTGTTTAGSTQITAVSNTTGMVVGMPIMCDNAPGTYISNANQIRNAITAISGSTITIASAATISGTGAVLQVNGLTSLQWRAGTPATQPSWYTFLADQFEVVNNGNAGVIRLYGFMPSLRDNMLRASYYAGYPVDWSNAGSSTHLLPSNITDMVENLIVRRFKRRQLADKGSEGLEGATTTWNKELNDEDKAVIDQYRRVPTIF